MNIRQLIEKARRRLIPLVIILGGVAASVFAFRAEEGVVRDKIRLEFEQAADNRFAAFKREMESDLEALAAIQALYASDEYVDRSEFKSFTETLLARHKGIQALEWIPRVPASEREACERKARKNGFSGFEITERISQGVMGKAGRRNEYFPVYYVEPYQGNEIALGFDLASEPTRRRTLEESRDSGRTSATGRIILVQEKAWKPGVIVFAPIYLKADAPGSVHERRKKLKGFALGVFRMGDILERSLNYLERGGIDIYLYDKSVPDKDSFLYYHPARTRKTNGRPVYGKAGDVPKYIEKSEIVDVAGRKWLFLCRSSPDFKETRETAMPFAVLVGGLLLTGLVSAYLQAGIERTERVEQLVAERSRQLLDVQRELVEREKLAVLGRIAEAMGNELLNPLGVMSNAVFFLENKMPDAGETVREYLRMIREEIVNSRKIISDLLDYNNVKDPRAVPVQVRELVDRGLRGCSVPQNVAVSTDIPDGLSCVNADLQQIGKVLENLVTNAVQAMPEGGALRIIAREVESGKLKVSSSKPEHESRRPDDSDYILRPETFNLKTEAVLVEISVADTGEGIPPENMDKLFQPLFTTRSRGIGLGLALSLELAEANGGGMAVRSRPGEGAVFSLILPAGASGD